jgi:hypothetical protein
MDDHVTEDALASQHMNRVALLWTREKDPGMIWKSMIMMLSSHHREALEVAGANRSQEVISRMIGDQKDFIKTELPQTPIGEMVRMRATSDNEP